MTLGLLTRLGLVTYSHTMLQKLAENSNVYWELVACFTQHDDPLWLYEFLPSNLIHLVSPTERNHFLSNTALHSFRNLIRITRVQTPVLA